MKKQHGYFIVAGLAGMIIAQQIMIARIRHDVQMLAKQPFTVTVRHKFQFDYHYPATQPIDDEKDYRRDI